MQAIGDRIREIRRYLQLTQREFAERLGIKGPYVSELEKGKYEPSKQLILSMCGTFAVDKEWLEGGAGQMFDMTLVKRAHDGFPAKFPTERRFVENLVEQALHIEDGRIRAIMANIGSLFIEGDQIKIEAVEKMLAALIPMKSAAEWKRLRERRAALDTMIRARRIRRSGVYKEAREDFLWAVWIFTKYAEQGYFAQELEDARNAFEEFIVEDPEYIAVGDIFGKIEALVREQPGIEKEELLRATVDMKADIGKYFLPAAVILSKIKEVEETGCLRYYPLS